jgi:hypothetical protein
MVSPLAGNGLKWTREEKSRLAWLVREGHSIRSASWMLPGRSFKAIKDQAKKMGTPFSSRGDRHEKRFRVRLPQRIFASLSCCANEISIDATTLVRILLIVIDQKQLYAKLLDLQRDLSAPPPR